MRRGRGPERLRLRTSYPIPLPQARGGRSLARRPPPSCTQGSSLSPHSWLKEVPTLSVGATDRVPDPGGDPGPGPGVLWQGGHLHPCRGNLYTGLGGGCTPSEASRDPYTWTRAPKVGLAAQSAAGPRPVPASWPRALTGLATRQCPPGRTLSRPTRSGSERTLLSLEPPTLGKGLLSREHLPQRGCPAPRPPCQAGSDPWWPRGALRLQHHRAAVPRHRTGKRLLSQVLAPGQNCPLPCCESQTGPRERPAPLLGPPAPEECGCEGTGRPAGQGHSDTALASYLTPAGDTDLWSGVSQHQPLDATGHRKGGRPRDEAWATRGRHVLWEPGSTASEVTAGL